jgi:Carbamoyl-phosphate synthase L chain, ATP binding domain
VPVLSGSDLMKSAEEAAAVAGEVGFPVLLKATGGGGGIGIYICRSVEDVLSQYEVASRQGKANFGDAGVLSSLSSCRSQCLKFPSQHLNDVSDFPLRMIFLEASAGFQLCALYLYGKEIAF